MLAHFAESATHGSLNRSPVLLLRKVAQRLLQTILAEDAH